MISRYVIKPFFRFATFISIEIFRAVLFYFIVIKLQDASDSKQFRDEL